MLRGLHPALAAHFKKVELPKHAYGFRNLVSVDICQTIIERLDLQSKYNQVDVVDVHPGVGLFSTILNAALKPRNHIIVEHNREYLDAWKKRLALVQPLGNKENFRLIEKDGRSWLTFSNMFNEKVLEPEVQLRDRVHSELLVVANLTPPFGEPLFAQWIMCSVYRNWIQRYGRVRMVCFVPETTAVRFLSGPNYRKRNKSAIKRSIFTDSKLIAITEPVRATQHEPVMVGEGYDPNRLFQDQPFVIPRRAVMPVAGTMAVVEVVPKDFEQLDVSLLEFMLEGLMFRLNAALEEAFPTISPGVEDDLLPKVPEALRKRTVRSLTNDEFLLLLEIFDKWAFKPSEVDRLSLYFDENA